MLQASYTVLAWEGYLTCMGSNSTACNAKACAGVQGEAMLQSN